MAKADVQLWDVMSIGWKPKVRGRRGALSEKGRLAIQEGQRRRRERERAEREQQRGKP